MMSNEENNPEELVDPHAEGKKYFQRGLIVYYLLAVLGVIYGVFFFRGTFGLAGGLALAACFVIAPFKLKRGSEGWKMFTHLFGLFLAMFAFGGGCSVVESETRSFGFISLGVFALAVYLVRVFCYNMKVAAYMNYLRGSGLRHGQRSSAKENNES